MTKGKIECENGWIVFVVDGHKVVQVHSTGEIWSGTDDRATGRDLIRLLVDDAIDNQLHSQAPSRSGVRWPVDTY